MSVRVNVTTRPGVRPDQQEEGPPAADLTADLPEIAQEPASLPPVESGPQPAPALVDSGLLQPAPTEPVAPLEPLEPVERTPPDFPNSISEDTYYQQVIEPKPQGRNVAFDNPVPVNAPDPEVENASLGERDPLQPPRDVWVRDMDEKDDDDGQAAPVTPPADSTAPSPLVTGEPPAAAKTQQPEAPPAPAPILTAAEKKQKEDLATWQRETGANLEKFLLNFSTFKTDHHIDVRRGALIRQFMNLHVGHIPDHPTSYEVLREHMAEHMFKGRGSGSDEAFFGQLQNWAQGRKDNRGFNRELTSAAVLFRLSHFESEDVDMFLAKNTSHPGRKAGQDHIYISQWNEIDRAVRKKYGDKVLEQVDLMWDTLKEGGNDFIIFDVYYRLNKEERKLSLELLRHVVNGLPKEEQDSFWENMDKSYERAVSGIVRGVGNMAEEASYIPLPQNVLMHHTTEILSGHGMGEDFFTATDRKRHDKNLRRGFIAEFRKILEEEYDPVVPIHEDGFLGFLEGVAYAAPSAVLSTAVAFIPYAGPVIMAGIMENDAYESSYTRLTAHGLDADTAARNAQIMAPMIAAPQALVERFGGKYVAGKVPVIKKAMTKFDDMVANKVLKVTGHLVGEAIDETITEAAQGIMFELGHEISGWLDSELPGAEWQEHFQGYASQNLTTFVVSFPLGLLGLGRGKGVPKSVSDRAFSQASDLELSAFGMTDEGIRGIRDAQDEAGLTAAVDAAIAGYDPSSDSARDATERLAQEMKQRKELEREAVENGVSPDIRANQNKDGFEVFDPSNNRLLATADNQVDALTAAIDISKAREQQIVDGTDQMVSMLEGKQPAPGTRSAADPVVARLLARRTASRLADIRSTQQLARMQVAHLARSSAQNRTRERLAGIGGAASAHVFGSSPRASQRRQRQTFNRLQNGVSPTRILGDDTRNWFASAVRSGRLDHRQTEKFVRGLDAYFASRARRGRTPLRLLPKGDTATPLQIEQAVARYTELMVLQSDRGRKSNQREAVDTAVTNAAEHFGSPVARQIRAFASSQREFFSAALSRHLFTQRALADGTVSRADLPAFNASIDRTIDLEINRATSSSDSNSDTNSAPQLTEEQFEQVASQAFDNAQRDSVVNVDNVRPLIPGYAQADPLTRDTDFHAIARDVNREVLARMLALPSNTGRVTLLAGGVGSGKSFALDMLNPRSDFTIDGVLGNLPIAQALIDQVRDSGRQAEIIYVHRPFGLAFEGAVERFLDPQDGRLVPLDLLAKAHIGAQETILALEGSVDIRVIENTGEPGGLSKITLEQLRSQRYLEQPNTTREGTDDNGQRTQEETDQPGRGRGRSGLVHPGSQEGNRQEGSRRENRLREAYQRLLSTGRDILARHLGDGSLTRAQVAAIDPNTGRNTGRVDRAISDAQLGDLGGRPADQQFAPGQAVDARSTEILESLGYQSVDPADPLGRLGWTQREIESFERATGTRVQFFESPDGSGNPAGFVAGLHPNVIFINARSTGALNTLLAHELIHVAQRDPSSGYADLDRQIRALLSDENLADLRAEIESRDPSYEGNWEVELLAYLAGDAMSGSNEIGLDSLENAAEIRATIQDYFANLGRLDPQALADSPDIDLATSNPTPENNDNTPLTPGGLDDIIDTHIDPIRDILDRIDQDPVAAMEELFSPDNHIASRGESHVYSLGDDLVIKQVRDTGILVLDQDGEAVPSNAPIDVRTKVRGIRAMDGLPTSYLQIGGLHIIIQDRATEITVEEFRAATFPFGIRTSSKRWKKEVIEIDGQFYYVSDLVIDNIMKDRHGVIRISDPVVSQQPFGRSDSPSNQNP